MSTQKFDGIYFSVKNIFGNSSRIIFINFDTLPNFTFTTSETMHNYYLQTWYTRVASRAAERIRNMSKPHRMRMRAQCPVPLPK